MKEYRLTFSKDADAQLNEIYGAVQTYRNGHFTEGFKKWNYELHQYLRVSAFFNCSHSAGVLSMGRIGLLSYYIRNVNGINVVTITEFSFRMLPFMERMSLASPKLIITGDAGYGISIIQNTSTRKYGLSKPNKTLVAKCIFDDIIGFHHSTEDYNKMHAIGFIGNRVSKY